MSNPRKNLPSGKGSDKDLRYSYINYDDNELADKLASILNQSQIIYLKTQINNYQ